VAVSERLAPFLPGPLPRPVPGEEGRYRWTMPEQSIGRIHGWHGNALVLARAYAYILFHGGDGLTEIGRTAVLNARYLKERLRGVYDFPYDGPCMHEFVASSASIKKASGAKALDLAKRLIEEGFHPPTMYFPLIVDEALMVEPTETETRESLDAFADAIEEILTEAETDPELAKNAPYSTPVRRLDEVRATRKPVVRQAFDVEGGDGGAAEAAASRGPSGGDAKGPASETDFNDATSPADSDA
jgi:glycine dehydrogenase subunit 2